MDKFKFFFDTADTKYIEDKWALYSEDVSPDRVLGVTTNPNAFAKESLNTMKEWEGRTRELCTLVTKIKGGAGGSVHVQMPNDNMTPDEVFAWAKKISSWTDGTTKVSLKIPPYKRYLNLVSELSGQVDVNVTGISDCVTALMCAARPVKFVSIIPGRMEEVGIKATDHVWTAMNARSKDTNWEIITGSMRTLDGLRWCVEAGTVPTIGKRVFDLITPENQAEVFGWFADTEDNLKQDIWYKDVGPSSVTIRLSKEFFLQMNELGNGVYKEFSESGK